jgi:siroheme synthase
LPAAIIEHGTTERHRLVLATLGSLAAVAAQQSIGSPALVLIGDTVRYAERYAWFGGGSTRGDDDGSRAQVS